eukprot:189375_1
MSNWDVLQTTLKQTDSSSGTKKRRKIGKNNGKGGLGGRQRNELNQAVAKAHNAVGGAVSAKREKETVCGPSIEEKLRYIAIDCEMVGVGNLGKESALARCCIVNWDGEVVYDQYVRPKEFVTDFRTSVSGVQSKHLRKATELTECQTAVAELIDGKIIVGHALKHDFQALLMNYPHHMIRDTATYKPLKCPHGTKLRPRSLKSLSKEFLDRDIQQGKHNPGEDARAAMDLYKKFREEWEFWLTGGKKSKNQKNKNNNSNNKKRKRGRTSSLVS